MPKPVPQRHAGRPGSSTNIVIVDLPVLYSAYYVLRGHRNTSSSTVLQVQPFSVRSFTRNEVELAALASVTRHEKDEAGGLRAIPTEYPYYAVGDALLRPVRVDPTTLARTLNPAHEVTRDALYAATATAVAAARQGRQFEFAFGDPWSGTKLRATLYDEINYRRWDGDNLVEKTAAIQAYLDRCAFVDGRLCLPSKGPRWAVVARRQNGAVKFHSTVLLLEPPSEAKMKKEEILAVRSASNREAAITEARRLTDRLYERPPQQRPPQPEPVGGIEILRPDLFPDTDLMDLACWCIAQFDTKIRFSGYVTQFSPETFLALANLRRDRNALNAGEPVDLDEVVRHIREVANSWAGILGRDCPSEEFFARLDAFREGLRKQRLDGTLDLDAISDPYAEVVDLDGIEVDEESSDTPEEDDLSALCALRLAP